MASKPPQRLKRPVPKYIVAQLIELAQRQQALNEQINRERGQLLNGFAGALDIDVNRFRLYVDVDENPPTYEVLTIAEAEQRQRLRAAMTQAAASAPKADPAPRKGETPLALAEGAG